MTSIHYFLFHNEINWRTLLLFDERGINQPTHLSSHLAIYSKISLYTKSTLHISHVLTCVLVSSVEISCIFNHYSISFVHFLYSKAYQAFCTEFDDSYRIRRSLLTFCQCLNVLVGLVTRISFKFAFVSTDENTALRKRSPLVPPPSARAQHAENPLFCLCCLYHLQTDCSQKCGGPRGKSRCAQCAKVKKKARIPFVFEFS